MSKTTSRDGTTIAFERTGEGEPLVLVDGALCFRGFGPMGRLAHAFAPNFAVYTYDRRGRGESGDTAPHAVAREIEDLDALIAEAGGSAHMLGVSSGAALALEAAASGLPIAKLVLYEPPYWVDEDDRPHNEEFSRRLRELIADDRRGDAVEWFLSAIGVPAETLAGMQADASWQVLEGIAPTLGYDVDVLGDGFVPRERAATIEVSTLVANGAESPDFFREAALAVAAAIPGAHRRTLEGHGWGQGPPEALVPIVEEFLLGSREPMLRR